jgi:phage tail sheath protein FI
VVLETWDNLTLDPTTPNYIEKVIGNQTTTIATDGSDTFLQLSGNYQNQSRYIRVKQVNRKTPYYIDNSGDPVSAFTSSIPIASSGSFGSATGTNIPATEGKYYDNITNTNSQGLIASDYTQAINLLSNKDEYQFKYISTPGLVRDFASHASVVNSLITKCQERGDTMAIVDMLDYNANISEVVSEASTVNNSYASTYWPWLQTLDPNTGQQVWVPASTMVPSIYAFTDSISEPWIAPAGITRGTLPTVIKAERILTQGNRDTLYEANINPIATFPNSGVTVFGQKTLQKKKSALDRVNVRRLLIELKSTIKQIADTLVFEQNTVATRNDFTSQVNPYLSSVQQRQGLYTYRVVMDETNNTPTVIDNNQLVGAIYLQPVRTAEFIVLDFNVTQTGVTFE